jgi:hypothetical protein
VVELTLKIKSGNAAFGENPIGELRRILFAAAERLHSGDALLRDINGNRVGVVSVVIEEDA